MFIGLLDLAGTEPSLGTSQKTGLTLSPSTAGFPIEIDYVEASADVIEVNPINVNGGLNIKGGNLKIL